MITHELPVLRLYNSLTERKETFTVRDKRVGVYVCGITPYDASHLGHAFTYVHFDVLVRWLRHRGHRVTYVQNLTDVDDDILRKSKELGQEWRTLGEQVANQFLDDMYWMGNLYPDIYPRATDLIPDMIALIRELLRKGRAYEKNGSVYFKVRSYAPFGQLSKLPRDRWLPIANERGNHPEDPNKQDPIDFVLWQAQKPGEPFWNSPWGKGRPGWHIECSVMAEKFLGSPVDISGGGNDLIFPHHECSLAQSESAAAKPFVRYWLHTAMVMYQEKKMSKSEGNMVFVKDLRRLGADAARLCVLLCHYRQTWHFQDGDTRKAQELAALFREVWRMQSGSGAALDPSPYDLGFHAAMNDDLNTPKALEVMAQLAREILRDASRRVSEAKGFLNRACNILGVRFGYGNGGSLNET
jgi:L-cysteine:1D-myo-inositol 2-amino-2-deoxy-alpha-D-glucopyranoside ligase